MRKGRGSRGSRGEKNKKRKVLFAAVYVMKRLLECSPLSCNLFFGSKNRPLHVIRYQISRAPTTAVRSAAACSVILSSVRKGAVGILVKNVVRGGGDTSYSSTESIVNIFGNNTKNYGLQSGHKVHSSSIPRYYQFIFTYFVLFFCDNIKTDD
jgi:hypothetical protein